MNGFGTESDASRYEDIINLPHHQSATHPHMPIGERAAQFSPFAALTGYEDAIEETARLTENRVELSESDAEILDLRIQKLRDMIENRHDSRLEKQAENGPLNLIEENAFEEPEVIITYFVPDSKKSGGEYVSVSGSVRKIDEYRRSLILTDGREILLSDIMSIEGKCFK